MNGKRNESKTMGFIIGFLVVAAGVILLLKSMGVKIDIHVKDFWPLIIIFIGLDNLRKSKIWTGLIATTIGTLFLLNNLGQISFRFKDLWPILVILIGLNIIYHSLFGRSKSSSICCGKNDDSKSFFSSTEDHNIDSDFFNISSFLGSAKHTYNQKNFKGGKTSGVFAGIEIDLREAEMAGDSASINVSAFMAGIEIYIPNNWKATIQSSSFMAGIENKTKTTSPADKELFIKGSAFMSGIEIKN